MPVAYLPYLYKGLGHLGFLTASMGGILAVDINFNDQITLGTIILSGIVIIVAGIFTIRSKVASSWHDAFTAEQTLRIQAEADLSKEKLSRLEFEASQQRLRHDLKNDLATRDLQIKALESKTDLTTAMDAIKDIARAQELGTQELKTLLTEIRDRMPQQGANV